MWGTLLLLVGAIITTQTSPSGDLKPCRRDDKECLIKLVDILYKETVSGNPALDMESLDPIYHEEVDGGIETLKFKLYNTTIKGFKDCIMGDVALAKDISSLHLELDCPAFNVRGIYEMDGKILAFPVQGKGDYVMDFKDYHIVFDSDLTVTEKDGKRFITMTTYKFSAKLAGGNVDMANLFNGQKKELADAVLKIINENLVALASELQGPIVKVNIVKLVKNFNKLFKSRDISTIIV